MTIPEILRQLQRVPEKTDFAPYEAALRAAADQRDAITPGLIAAIDRVSSDPAHYLEDPEDCLHLFAIYLLAQFRENRALECFLRFFALSGDQALDLTGDLVTEQGAAVLASVCGGDPAPLLRLIHDESVNEFVRTQAMDALAVQSLWEERPREAVVEDLRRLFHTLPKPGNAHVWAGLTGLVCDFHLPELAPEARQAFAEGLVDETVLDLDYLEEALSERGEESLASSADGTSPSTPWWSVPVGFASGTRRTTRTSRSMTTGSRKPKLNLWETSSLRARSPTLPRPKWAATNPAPAAAAGNTRNAAARTDLPTPPRELSIEPALKIHPLVAANSGTVRRFGVLSCFSGESAAVGASSGAVRRFCEASLILLGTLQDQNRPVSSGCGSGSATVLVACPCATLGLLDKT